MEFPKIKLDDSLSRRVCVKFDSIDDSPCNKMSEYLQYVADKVKNEGIRITEEIHAYLEKNGMDSSTIMVDFIPDYTHLYDGYIELTPRIIFT